MFALPSECILHGIATSKILPTDRLPFLLLQRGKFEWNKL